MLAKLMKYEFKATSRLLVPLYLILLLFSIINRFVFRPDSNNGAVQVINALLMFSYILLIFTVLIVTVIYMIARFYKNLLTDEGYLMFTLPAKAHQLITSKLLVTVIWFIMSIVIILISLFIAFATADSMPAVMNEIRNARIEFNRAFGGNTPLLIIEMIIMCLLSLVVNILLIYVSIALGQSFTKHKIIGSFGAYMVIYTIIQFVMLILIVILGGVTPRDIDMLSVLPKVFFPMAIVMLVIMGACCYLGTNHIFKKKLNLD